MHTAELQVERTGRVRRRVREHPPGPPFTKALGDAVSTLRQSRNRSRGMPYVTLLIGLFALSPLDILPICFYTHVATATRRQSRDG